MTEPQVIRRQLIIQQVINGVMFFASLSASATILADAPQWVSAVLAFIAAVASAVAVARGRLTDDRR